MKYYITISGKGYNIVLHQLSREIFNSLQESNQEDYLNAEKVSELMGVDSVYNLLLVDSVVNKTYVKDFLGLPLNECYITVSNELGKIILNEEEVDADKFFEERDFTIIDEDPLYFFICESIKGIFFNFHIDLVEPFDFAKIKPIIQEYPEDIFTIVGLEYDGMVLINESVGDFNGSGEIDFYLSNA